MQGEGIRSLNDSFTREHSTPHQGGDVTKSRDEGKALDTPLAGASVRVSSRTSLSLSKMLAEAFSSISVDEGDLMPSAPSDKVHKSEGGAPRSGRGKWRTSG